MTIARRPSDKFWVILLGTFRTILGQHDLMKFIPLTNNARIYTQSTENIAFTLFYVFHFLAQGSLVSLFTQTSDNPLALIIVIVEEKS
jgi:hypothetical protein